MPTNRSRALCMPQIGPPQDAIVPRSAKRRAREDVTVGALVNTFIAHLRRLFSGGGAQEQRDVFAITERLRQKKSEAVPLLQKHFARGSESRDFRVFVGDLLSHMKGED